MPKFPITQEFFDTLDSRRHDEHYTPMARIGDVQRLHREMVRKTSNQAGLPCSYRTLLFHLSILEPGVTQLTLVKAAHLKPPTVSVTLQKMEADGLVIRRANENDLRQTLVYLSEKGKAVNDSIFSSFEHSDDVAMNGFTAEEKEQLNKYLDRIVDNFIAARLEDSKK